MLLEGQVAVVTGSGRGIGRAMARRFAAEGAAVVVASRTATEVEGGAAEIEKHGGRAVGLAADVSREADCARIVSAARERFGEVHILVNNAGFYGPVKPIEEITPQEWDEVVAVHLRAAFLLTRLVLPEMLCAGLRSDPEHLQHLGQGRIRLGFALCGGQGRHAGADACGGGGSGTKRSASQCAVPRPCDRDAHVKGLGSGACRKDGRHPRETVGRVPREGPAAPGADGGRGGRSCAFPCFHPGERDYWAGSERGRRNGFLLRSSSNPRPRRARTPTLRVRGSTQAMLRWPARSNRKNTRATPARALNPRVNRNKAARSSRTK